MKISRCRDLEKIKRILSEHYTDIPVKYFTKGALKSLSIWCAKNPSVCFLLAEVDGKEAGFLFGHCLGSRIWRIFACQRPEHIANLAWVWLLQRVRRVMRNRSKSGLHHKPSNTSPQLKLTELDQPFPWHSTWGNGGIIELVIVFPDFRGRSIAPGLIKFFDSEMSAMGIPFTEAHIAQHNNASARAFLKAGWAIYRTEGGDIWASNPDQSENRRP